MLYKGEHIQRVKRKALENDFHSGCSQNVQWAPPRRTWGKEELKSTLCRDIQEKVFGRFFYLANEEKRYAFLKASGHSETKYPKVCGIATQVATEKILELIQNQVSQ